MIVCGALVLLEPHPVSAFRMASSLYLRHSRNDLWQVSVRNAALLITYSGVRKPAPQGLC